MASSSSEDSKIREWQKDVVRSIADDAPATVREPLPARSHPPPFRSEPPPSRAVVVNQIVTNSPVIVTRVKAPEPKPSEEISTRAMIGTVVGATAGAFIAYAMVKGASEDSQPTKIRERVTYRTIEAPAEYHTIQSRPTIRIPIEDSRSHHDPLANRSSAVHTIVTPPPRAETLATTAQHSRHSDTRGYKVVSSRDGPIVMIDNEANDPRSHAPSNRTAVLPPTATHAPPSAPVTEVRIARDVPLPTHSQASRYSRGTSATAKPPSKAPAPLVEEPREKPLPSVVPNDSISQVSTRRSKDSGRSKHHRSSHHGRSKEGHRSEREYEGRRGSKVGDIVDDVVGALKGTSIKERRSVRG